MRNNISPKGPGPIGRVYKEKKSWACRNRSDEQNAGQSGNEASPGLPRALNRDAVTPRNARNQHTPQANTRRGPGIEVELPDLAAHDGGPCVRADEEKGQVYDGFTACLFVAYGKGRSSMASRCRA
jgi:hypothetical protein